MLIQNHVRITSAADTYLAIHGRSFVCIIAAILSVLIKITVIHVCTRSTFSMIYHVVDIMLMIGWLTHAIISLHKPVQFLLYHRLMIYDIAYLGYILSFIILCIVVTNPTRHSISIKIAAVLSIIGIRTCLAHIPYNPATSIDVSSDQNGVEARVKNTHQILYKYVLSDYLAVFQSTYQYIQHSNIHGKVLFWLALLLVSILAYKICGTQKVHGIVFAIAMLVMLSSAVTDIMIPECTEYCVDQNFYILLNTLKFNHDVMYIVLLIYIAVCFTVCDRIAIIPNVLIICSIRIALQNLYTVYCWCYPFTPNSINNTKTPVIRFSEIHFETDRSKKEYAFKTSFYDENDIVSAYSENADDELHVSDRNYG
jgi:hypothetical protein